MITKRIIPCLDVRDGRVVKGVRFQGLRDIADPVEMAQFYNEQGADELVFYDITASFEKRALFWDVLERVASAVFIPLTVGGGIRAPGDFERALRSGADKVSVNSGAIREPSLIREAAKRFGSQCVVLSMDIKRVRGEYHVFLDGGRLDTGINAAEWAARGESEGAGELVVNSMDADGMRGGFDMPMLDAIAKVSSLPLIASGGAGKKENFLELFRNKRVDAGLAAGIFHSGEVGIQDLKKFLREYGTEVRL